MLNRNNDNHYQHNYQSVTINMRNESGGALFGMIAAITTVSLIAGAIIVVAVLAYHALLALVASLTAPVTALAAGLMESIPWLVAGSVVLVILAYILRTIPQAVTEARMMRLPPTQRPYLLLESKEVDNVVLDLRPVSAEVER